MRRTPKLTHPKYHLPNPLAPPQTHIPDENTERLPAIIVDVVTNDDHPEYHKIDGYNVGCVRFRFVGVDQFRPDNTLHWAYPDDSTIVEFPVKNEIVMVWSALNRFYYTRKLNIGNRPSQQAMIGLQPEHQPITSPSDQNDAIDQSTAIPQNVSAPDGSSDYGISFLDKPAVYRLRHWEGDVIFEGRSGQSIRFGAGWLDPKIHKGVFQSLVVDQSPNILIRVGPWDSAPHLPNNDFGNKISGRVTEDINKDKTSAWMSTDLVVPLITATVNNTTINKKSIPDYPSQFAGNQLILNTDRFILNTKTDKVLIHSFLGFHVTTLKNATFDIERDYLSYVGQRRRIEIISDNLQNVGRNRRFWIGGTDDLSVVDTLSVTVGAAISQHSEKLVSIIAPKIYLGTAGSEQEPMALGETLRQLLLSFVDAHLNNASNHVITMMGPGTLSPGVVAALQQVKAQLQNKTILSDDNFLVKNNDTPRTVPVRIPIHDGT